MTAHARIVKRALCFIQHRPNRPQSPAAPTRRGRWPSPRRPPVSSPTPLSASTPDAPTSARSRAGRPAVISSPTSQSATAPVPRSQPRIHLSSEPPFVSRPALARRTNRPQPTHTCFRRARKRRLAAASIRASVAGYGIFTQVLVPMSIWYCVIPSCASTAGSMATAAYLL